MSQGEGNALDLDIDDGTAPVADAAQTDETADETVDAEAQIDGDAGDADTTQRDEVTETTEAAEEAAPVAEAKPETKTEQAAPTRTEMDEAAERIAEEFGSEAAAPFVKALKEIDQLKAELASIRGEREAIARQTEYQAVTARATAAGVPTAKIQTVYQDAIDYLNLRRSQGRQIGGDEALTWAIRAHGGNPEAAAKTTTKTTKTEKAERLQGLRSVPPRSRAGGALLDPDDPAVVDGTAPRRSS
jgi:hypothetical protein